MDQSTLTLSDPHEISPVTDVVVTTHVNKASVAVQYM